MKAFRLALLTILLFGFTTAIQSQEKSLFSVGNSTVSVGIGLPSTFTNILIPPITTSYEYCIIDFGRKIGSIGVGGLAGYAFHRYTYGDAIYTDHYILIGPKGRTILTGYLMYRNWRFTAQQYWVYLLTLHEIKVKM